MAQELAAAGREPEMVPASAWSASQQRNECPCGRTEERVGRVGLWRGVGESMRAWGGSWKERKGRLAGFQQNEALTFVVVRSAAAARSRKR